MNQDSLPHRSGRSAFGASASDYHESRPNYPAWVFERLVFEQALYPGANTLEIGPGNGLATRKLIEYGASQLTLVEPDARFESFLSGPDSIVKDAQVTGATVIYDTFESAQLKPGSFDLTLIATGFHWLEPQTRVSRLAELSKPGGYVALIWNVFQDLKRPDPFHEATKNLLANLPSSPSGQPDAMPFALDRVTRETEMTAAGEFELTLCEESHWQYWLDSTGIRSLYASFSNISCLPEPRRATVLEKLALIAQEQFSDRVARNMTTVLYLFKRS